VYQEQVMQIFRELAGYSYARADLVRRAMSKKDTEVMAQEREFFLKGCKDNHIDEEAAAEIFEVMNKFAEYAFNKSHAAAYALVSYRTAYLKCYYKEEYLCALMTSVMNDTVKLSEYASECSRLKIKIEPPDINYSESDFSVSPDRSIRYGLSAIKNVGVGFIKNMIFERETNGVFKSFDDFLKRIIKINSEQMNKRQIEALIKCGVFDSLGVFRSKLLAKYEEMIDNLLNEKRVNISGQMDLFSISISMSMSQNSEFENANANTSSAAIYPDIPELSRYELLAMEKEASGRFFSGHPIEEYTDALKKLNSLSISNVIEFFDEESDESTARDKYVTTAGITGDINIKRTKNGDNMAFFTLEDEFSVIEVVVFPKKYEQFGRELTEGEIIAVNGNISPGREDNAKIYLNNIIRLDKNENNEKNGGLANSEMPVIPGKSVLYIKVPVFDEENILYKKAVNLIEIFDGSNEVKIYDDSTKKIYSRKNPGADLKPVFLSELANLLGEENVKIK
jgi:DNA polymerase-3 subunit alpha